MKSTCNQRAFNTFPQVIPHCTNEQSHPQRLIGRRRESAAAVTAWTGDELNLQLCVNVNVNVNNCVHRRRPFHPRAGLWKCSQGLPDFLLQRLQLIILSGDYIGCSHVLHGESSKRPAPPRNTKDMKYLQSTQTTVNRHTSQTTT